MIYHKTQALIPLQLHFVSVEAERVAHNGILCDMSLPYIISAQC